MVTSGVKCFAFLHYSGPTNPAPEVSFSINPANPRRTCPPQEASSKVMSADLARRTWSNVHDSS